MFDIDAALMKVIEADGSDLHLKVPSRPVIRRHGKLLPIPDTDGLRPDDTERTLFHMLTDESKLESFRAEREVDFSYSIPGVARFRVNAFVQRGSVSLVCRAIPFQIKTAEELLLPPVITEIADEERGLILHDRDHRLGQVDDARGDDRPHQHAATRSTSSRSRIRSSSCIATSSRSSTSARSARTPRPSPAPCGACCARTPT